MKSYNHIELLAQAYRNGARRELGEGSVRIMAEYGTMEFKVYLSAQTTHDVGRIRFGAARTSTRARHRPARKHPSAIAASSSAKRRPPSDAPIATLLTVSVAAAAMMARAALRLSSGCGASRAIETVIASTSNNPAMAAPAMAPDAPKISTSARPATRTTASSSANPTTDQKLNGLRSLASRV